MDSQTPACGKPPGDIGCRARTWAERSDIAAENHRRWREFPAAASRGAAGTGARVSRPAGDRCHRGGLSAWLRGCELVLSSVPNVGRDDTRPVEGGAQTGGWLDD